MEERPARGTKSPPEGLGVHSWKASSEDEDWWQLYKVFSQVTPHKFGWWLIHSRKLLTLLRNPQKKSLFLLMFCYIILKTGRELGWGRDVYFFVCLLRCPKSELNDTNHNFFLPRGIRKREGIDNPDFYQCIFRRNMKGIIKTFHLVCSVSPTNKILLNAAKGRWIICQNYWHSQAVILVTTESKWMSVI